MPRGEAPLSAPQAKKILGPKCRFTDFYVVFEWVSRAKPHTRFRGRASAQRIRISNTGGARGRRPLAARHGPLFRPIRTLWLGWARPDRPFLVCGRLVRVRGCGVLRGEVAPIILSIVIYAPPAPGHASSVASGAAPGRSAPPRAPRPPPFLSLATPKNCRFSGVGLEQASQAR